MRRSQYVANEVGISIEKVTPEMLGTCERVIVAKEECTIVNDGTIRIPFGTIDNGGTIVNQYTISNEGEFYNGNGPALLNIQ